MVIVHGNQEPQSWATITWDNAFSDIVREPFQVPERVSWSQLALALNTKFESSTGRALTEDNLHFICKSFIVDLRVHLIYKSYTHHRNIGRYIRNSSHFGHIHSLFRLRTDQIMALV